MKVLKVGINKKTPVLFHNNDKKILSLLCHNIRLPTSKIARVLNLSRQSTEYRIKSMEKSHLIAGSRTVINIKKLGYHSYHFFLSINTNDSEKEFIKRCLSNEYVNTLLTYSGNLNYELSIIAKTPEEAKSVFEFLTEGLKVGYYFPCLLIENIKASILPGFLPDKIPVLKNIKNDTSFLKQFELKKKDYDVDFKDKMILFSLSQDAQISLGSIGRRVGLTKDSVSYRIKNLVRGGYILQFRPVIDYSILNLSVKSVLIKVNRMDEKEKKRFHHYLKYNNSVLWATEILGNWDYLLYVINREQERIYDFVKDIKKSFEDYIRNYEILFAYQIYKYSFMSSSMVK
tara:strand:+ start:16071 stop:17102 length:1032 start_codon:yes stop_codon:yes gene_type:complete